MTLRSVSVKFQADVTGAIASVRAFGTAVSTLDTKIRESTGKQKRAFDSLGRTGTIAALGLVGAFALATKATADFDKQMSQVKAATNASTAEMTKLRKEALQAGRDTAFSATAAAQGQTELAKAGVSTANILSGGLKGALDLAAAGQITVGEAAETAATAMTQFGLSGAAVPHIADLLSAGANKAQGSVHDLAFALKQSGLVANQFGLSVDDTVGTLSAFASAGLIGQDAGTSFKQMLLQLAAPSKQAASLMHTLGIEAYDSAGKFVGITGLAQELHDKLGGLTQAQRQAALATIFGTDAIRSASVLYNQGGRGIQAWIDKTNDAGNASRTAATKLDNLSGDLTKLKGSIETALIQAGSGGTSALRDMAQAATGVVNAFLSLPSGVQGSVVWIAGIAGAAILGVKGLTFLINTAKDAKVALIALGVAEERIAASSAAVSGALSGTASFLTGPWGLAIGAAVGLIALFATTTGGSGVKATQDFTEAIKEDSGALGEHTRAVLVNHLEQQGLLKTAQDMGVSLPLLTSAILGNKDAYAQVNAQIDAYIAKAKASNPQTVQDAYAVLNKTKAANALKDAINQQSQAIQSNVASAQRQSSANQATSATQQQATTTAQKQTSAENALSQALTGATKNADDLKAALDALSKANITADEAAIAQRKAVQDAGKASDHHRGLIDKERSGLIDLAKANQQVLITMKADGATSDELSAKQRALYSQFVKLAVGMGLSRAEAQKLAERYGILAPRVDGATSSVAGWITKAQVAASAARVLEMHTGGVSSAQQVYTQKVRDALPVLYALAGSNQAARAQVDALARSSGIVAGQMGVSHDAFLRNAGAMGIGKKRAEELWTALQKLKDPITGHATVYATGSWRTNITGGISAVSKAGGGEIPATHPGASRAYDSVPAMLRVDEHVWTPEEVDAAGGHSAMYRMRKLAKAGKLKGYATGGQVSLNDTRSDSAVVGAVTQPISTGITDLMNTISSVMAAAWKKFAQSGGAVVAAARSQIGLPYSWGGGGTGGPSTGIGRGAGTYGFDCSGLTEYAWYKGRGVDIGGSTGPQAANSTSISAPRPGALGFVGNPIHHVMLASDKTGMVIQAPHTGAFVEEVARSSSNWRWPKGGYATGGAVTKLGDDFTSGKASPSQAALAKLLQVAGGASRRGEDHTAQIADASQIRIWAEPETQGEAYIPLASSKRGQSVQILSQVARAFGMRVSRHASGGIVGYADGGTTTDLNLSSILSDYTTTVNPASKADVTSAAKSRTSALRKLQDAEDALAKARKAHHKDWAKIREDERHVKQDRADLAAATKKLADTETRYRAGQQSPATQLGSALGANIKNTGAFISNLTKLNARGFGALAQQLLAMGGTDAEKIAADAVHFSDAKLKTLQNQVTTAQSQTTQLSNLGNTLTVSNALKSGKITTFAALQSATGLDATTLAAVIRGMQSSLAKTAAGRALLNDMKTYGFASGGMVSGPSGTDQVPIWATAGEWITPKDQVGPNLHVLQAIQAGARYNKAFIPGRQQAHPAPQTSHKTNNILPGATIQVSERADVDLLAQQLDWQTRTAAL